MGDITSKVYLLAYNLTMCLGWARILWLTIQNVEDSRTLWPVTKTFLEIFQTAAVLEILHGAIGIVKASPLIAAMQLYSRLFVLWGVLEICPGSRDCFGVPMILFTWSITEIVRYGYHFLNIIGFPQPLVWLRYTQFIVLYPVGVTGELICVYYALQDNSEKGLWGYTIPQEFYNAYNYAVMTGALILLGFPRLYIHLLAQRKKVLGQHYYSVTKPKTH